MTHTINSQLPWPIGSWGSWGEESQEDKKMKETKLGSGGTLLSWWERRPSSTTVPHLFIYSIHSGRRSISTPLPNNLFACLAWTPCLLRARTACSHGLFWALCFQGWSYFSPTHVISLQLQWLSTVIETANTSGKQLLQQCPLSPASRAAGAAEGILDLFQESAVAFSVKSCRLF